MAVRQFYLEWVVDQRAGRLADTLGRQGGVHLLERLEQRVSTGGAASSAGRPVDPCDRRRWTQVRHSCEVER